MWSFCRGRARSGAQGLERGPAGSWCLRAVPGIGGKDYSWKLGRRRTRSGAGWESVAQAAQGEGLRRRHGGCQWAEDEDSDDEGGGGAAEMMTEAAGAGWPV